MSDSGSQAASKRNFAWVEGILFVAGFAVFLGTAIFADAHRHNNDFKHIYLGTEALVHGESPYSPEALFMQAHEAGWGDEAINPFVYPPFTGLVMSFLAPFRFPAASQIWFFCSAICAVIALFQIACHFWPNFRLGAFGVLLFSFGICHPWIRTLTAGQLNAPLLLAYVIAFRMLEAGRERAAGSLLGIMAVYKITPAGHVLYFVLRRRWRGLVAMVVAAGGALLISGALFGWRPHLDYLPMMRQMSYGHSTWEQYGATFWKDPYNQSINSFLTHALVSSNRVTTPSFNFTQDAANLVTILCSLALVAGYVYTFRQRRVAVSPLATKELYANIDAAAYMGALLLSLLIPSLMWDHYLLMTILPVAWVVKRNLNERRRWVAVGAAMCFLLICIPMRFDTGQFRHGAGIVMMSFKLFPTLAILGLVGLSSRGKVV